MEPNTFTHALADLTADELRAVAAELDALARSSTDALAATRARLGVEHAVRCAHCRSRAGLAGYAASRAVLRTAAAAGIALPDRDVTRVARSAADVARAMVAGPHARREIEVLVRPWRCLPALADATAVRAAS